MGNKICFLFKEEVEMMESVGCRLIRCESTKGAVYFDSNWSTKIVIDCDGFMGTMGGRINGSQAKIVGQICQRITNEN